MLIGRKSLSKCSVVHIRAKEVITIGSEQMDGSWFFAKKTQFVLSMIRNHQIDWTLNDFHPLLNHEFRYIFKQGQ